MTPLLAEVYNAEQFRKSGHELIDLLADHLDAVQRGSTEKVTNWTEPEDELAFWKSYAYTDTDQLFKDVLARSIHIHHPKYIGHQVAPPAPLSALGSLMATLLNNGTGVYEMGAASNAMERVVTETIAQAVGYDTDQSSGLLTSGGTLANLTALLTARAVKAKGKIWEEGHSKEKLAIMVSDQAHYCVDRAARIMGLGSQGILKVPTNEQFQLRTELLEATYATAVAEGFTVIAIVGSACSTSTGSYDNLEAIGEFARANDIWFHVDGAHGGAVCFSSNYKHYMNGAELADSVVIDCHKMLMTSALCTALLYKDGHTSYCTFNQEAQYLWADQSEEWFNSGKRTFECTKLMLSLKFYSLIQVYGIQVFDDYVTGLYDQARWFGQLVTDTEGLELLVEPEANIVCFRVQAAGKTDEELNTLNAAVRRGLLENGRFYIVQTNINGKVYLRTTLMNCFTSEADLKALLQLIQELATQKN